MATAEQYAKWIVENADKKGSDEFNTVARAYQEAKALESKPAPAKKEVGLGEGLARSFGAGATFSFADEAEALARSKMPGETRSYEEILADVRGKQKAFVEEHPFLDIAGNIVGGVAAPLAAAALLPETAVAGAATGLAALASKLPMAGRVAQLAMKYPTLANVAKGAAIGAGYGGVSGFGAGEGGLEQRLESAGTGAGLGAVLGGAIPAVGKGLQLGTQAVKGVIAPLTASGRKKVASKIVQSLPEEELTKIQRQLMGNEAVDEAQSKIQEELRKYVAEEAPGDISAPFVSQQTKYQQALEAAKKEAEASALARSQAAGKTAATAAAALKTPTERLSSEISEAAKSKVDDVLDKVREHETSLWAPFSDPENPIPFKTMGKFKNTIADYKANLTGDDKKIVPKEIWKQLSGLPKEVNFKEIQDTRSYLLRRARDSTNPNDKRVFNELADAIYDGVNQASERGIGLPEEMLGQWNAARAATRNRAEVFGNPFVKSFFKEETKQAAPEAFLGRVLGGVEKKSKYQALENMLDPFKNASESVKATIPKEMLDAIQSNKSSIMSDLEQYLVTDLGKKAEAEGFVSPKNLKKWASNYEDLLKARPELGQRFGDIGKLQAAASEAADFAKQKVAERETEKLGKFFNVDPYDSSAITRRLKSLVESTDKNSVSNIVNQLSDDQDAINGLKRGFVDTIFESNKPHEFIAQNKNKLFQLFSNDADRNLLNKIEESSRKIELLSKSNQLNDKTIAKLMSEDGFLPLLLGESGALLARGAAVAGAYGVGASTIAPLAGVFTGAGVLGVPAITRKVLSSLYSGSRNKVVDILKEASTNPELYKELMEPIKPGVARKIITSFTNPDNLSRSGVIGPVSIYGAGKVAEPEPERKAIGGLASLKKRYG